MRYITIVFTLFVVVLLVSSAHAASIGNPIKSPGQYKVSVAIEDNFIFERDVEGGGSTPSFYMENMNQYYVKLLAAVTDFFHGYAKLGQSNGGEINLHTTDTLDTDVECEYGFLWGVGATVSHEFTDKLHVGLDVQYDQWNADVDEVKSDGTAATNVGGEIQNWEFQTALFIATDVHIFDWEALFTPYAAIAYNRFNTKTERDLTYTVGATNSSWSWDLNEGDSVGIILGVDVGLPGNMRGNIEGRLINEEAITFGLAYVF